MNCKKGDIALVLCEPFSGYVVECVEPTKDRNDGAPGWIVVPKLGKWRGVRDSALRPIRDSGGTDETLIYAGKPRELEQA